MEARIVCQPRALSVRLGRRVNQGSSRKTDQLLLARAWVSSQGGLNTPYVFTQMAEARRPGNGIQPDSSLAVGMVAWMPQQRINRFRFLPLERRRRHFDRPPFRFACGWTGNFRIAKFAICGQRLATLVLGRESPDWGCLLLQGAATYGVKDIWMVAALCTTSRADGARASGVMTFGNRPVTFGYLSVGMTCTSPRSLTTRVGGRRVVHFPRVEAEHQGRPGRLARSGRHLASGSICSSVARGGRTSSVKTSRRAEPGCSR